MYSDGDGSFPILACVLGITALVGMGLTIGGVASDNKVMTAIGLSMVAVPALISGGIAIAAGIAGATALGVIGGITAVAGVGTATFTSAEIQQSITGNNWILDAGMSQELYNGLMLTTAAVATIGTVTCGVLGSIGSMSTKSQMFNSIQNNPNRWNIVGQKIGSATGKSYRGGTSTYTNYINKWTGAKAGTHEIIRDGIRLHYHFHLWFIWELI